MEATLNNDDNNITTSALLLPPTTLPPLITALLAPHPPPSSSSSLSSSLSSPTSTSPPPPLPPPHRTAILLCGPSGSGKSTLARLICGLYPSFTRLSIDQTVYRTHGIYDVDYPAAAYHAATPTFADEAEGSVKRELRGLVAEARRDVVLDLAMYSREMRREWRGVIEAADGIREGEGERRGGERMGGRYRIVLIVVKARGGEETLWKRIRKREDVGELARGEGCIVDRETLRRYVAGFEWPEGEGEVVLEEW